jgi:hypothetical protein
MALVDRHVVGRLGNGVPSVVSLDAQTTRRRPRRTAAENTVCVLRMLVAKTTSGVACVGEGIAARCTTASTPDISSAPLSASSVWP